MKHHDAHGSSTPQKGDTAKKDKKAMEDDMASGGGAGMKGGMAMKGGHYPRLIAMLGVSFLVMFVLMFAMVDRFGNVYASWNQFYMAGLMAASMGIIELALMWGMYPDKKTNGIIIAISAIALVAFWVLIRQQVAITDRQFLRSMIPHHGGAVLMCQQNRLRDPELQRLCTQIIAAQKAEIEYMRAKLNGDDVALPVR
jgi:hypothetical protein